MKHNKEQHDFQPTNWDKTITEAPSATSNLRSPLETSSLENIVPVGDRSDRLTKSQNSWMRHSQPESHFNESKQVANLEKKLNEALKEKQALERVCAQLEKENAELKKQAREAGRKVLQTKWTEQDEEEFMASRRLRREAQNLIKAPVQEHLEKVNYVYGLKNQWCMTNKQHFSLQLPNHFQRAPELDIRDKARKEAQSDENEPNNEAAIRQTRSEDLGCATATRLSFGAPKSRASLVSLPRKSIERPAGMSALKRLTARRKSNL